MLKNEVKVYRVEYPSGKRVVIEDSHGPTETITTDEVAKELSKRYLYFKGLWVNLRVILKVPDEMVFSAHGPSYRITPLSEDDQKDLWRKTLMCIEHELNREQAS